ncbi:MAG: DUF4417 domain-containing protein [Prevotella sp.]|nr:DUF4417 domain-containing protein [Prevotella sp.]
MTRECMDIELSLFTPREEYFATHDKDGVSYAMKKLSETEQIKRKVDNLHLLEGITITNSFQMPKVDAYNGTTDFEMVSYNNRNRVTTSIKAIHFFMNDYQFIAPAWENVEKTTYSLVEEDPIVFAPDFSIYVDVPMPVNTTNIYRSRLVAAYWQKCGLRVIPTASWGNVDSFKYCFDGLPEYSVIAVCGIGHDYCRGANKLWHMAMHEMEKQISPSKIIVYGGKKPDDTQFNAEIVHFEDYITTHFRKYENNRTQPDIGTRGRTICLNGRKLPVKERAGVFRKNALQGAVGV